MDIPQDRIAWIAGLVEGEGSFCFTTGGYPRLSLNSTDLDVIERLVEWSGMGTIIKTNMKNRPAHYKQQYCWTVNKLADLLSLGDAIAPYLLERRAAKYADLRVVVSERLENKMAGHRPGGRKFIPGEGLCPSGHDKAVTGVTGQGYCSECNRLRAKRYYRHGPVHKTPSL